MHAAEYILFLEVKIVPLYRVKMNIYTHNILYIFIDTPPTSRLAGLSMEEQADLRSCFRHKNTGCGMCSQHTHLKELCTALA